MKKLCNFTLLIAWVWPQQCLNMLVSICKYIHKFMQEKEQKHREITHLIHIVLILVLMNNKGFSWRFFFIFHIVNKSHVQIQTNNELIVLRVYQNADISYSSVS